MQERPCVACKGRRLKPEVLAITVNKLSIMDICELSIDDAIDLMTKIKLDEKEKQIAEHKRAKLQHYHI